MLKQKTVTAYIQILHENIYVNRDHYALYSLAEHCNTWTVLETKP